MCHRRPEPCLQAPKKTDGALSRAGRCWRKEATSIVVSPLVETCCEPLGSCPSRHGGSPPQSCRDVIWVQGRHLGFPPNFYQGETAVRDPTTSFNPAPKIYVYGSTSTSSTSILTQKIL